MDFFSPLHLLILLFTALILFGIPLLFLFLLARWLDKTLQRRPGIRVSILGIVVGGIVDVVASGLLGTPLAIYVMVKEDLLHAPPGSPVIASTIHANGWLYGLELAIGLACSIRADTSPLGSPNMTNCLTGCSRRSCALLLGSIPSLQEETRNRLSATHCS